MAYNMRNDAMLGAIGKRRNNQPAVGGQLGQNQFQQQQQQQMGVTQFSMPIKEENNQNGQQQTSQPLMQIALEYDPNNPSLFGENAAAQEDQQPKKPWMKGGPRGKINKAEIRRRRNMRLSKILNPKNAVMILNELVKNVEYYVSDSPMSPDGQKFMATATFDGQQFTGFGRTKIMAKNEAAENAIKYVFRSKRMSAMSRSRDMNMDVDSSEGGTNDDESDTIPWQHIASFALYKLFDTWGEPMSTAAIANKGDSVDGVSKPNELKPAKKLPENPELINPLMLMNQMMPYAVFEELGQSGVAPNVMFTFKCIVNDKTFIGTGSSKKAAKKMAAFAACHDVLKINYPPEVYVPSPAHVST